ncbi:MAG TPA: DMT family transporter [Euzebya sp.]|nr:DMT family transporter [Euzebya sp.]
MTDRELDAFTPSDWGLLIGLALIWGSSFLFIAIGLDHFTPAQIAFLRISLGTAALALVPASRRGVRRRDWGRVALLGLLWMGIPFLLFPIAQQWIDSSLAGMLNGGVPLWAALVATLVARRLPPSGVLWGLGAGFAGILLISLPTLDTDGSTALGVGLVVVATVLYGISLNIAVPLQRRYGSLAVMLRAQAVAAVFTLPFAVAGVSETTFGWGAVAAVAALGILGTGLALAMMATLAGRVGAARGSIAIYLVPIVAIALGAIVRNELVSSVALLGTGLVIFGAWLTSRSQRAAVQPAGEVAPSTTIDLAASEPSADPAAGANA